MTPTQALTTIKAMADYSQKWHNETSSRNISNISNTDGLVAIISKLDNLGCNIKKLKENIHVIQVVCHIYEGPLLDKECPLNEEVKPAEEVNYGEFGCLAPFKESNEAKFRVEIEQLVDEYELGIGKKGYILEMIWENCKNIQGKAKEWWYVLWKPSRDFTHPLGPPTGLKGLLRMLNATVIPTKGKMSLLKMEIFWISPSGTLYKSNER
nr:hypothetical protein [Tanacetum cinerariifolium]